MPEAAPPQEPPDQKGGHNPSAPLEAVTPSSAGASPHQAQPFLQPLRPPPGGPRAPGDRDGRGWAYHSGQLPQVPAPRPSGVRDPGQPLASSPSPWGLSRCCLSPGLWRAGDLGGHRWLPVRPLGVGVGPRLHNGLLGSPDGRKPLLLEDRGRQPPGGTPRPRGPISRAPTWAVGPGAPRAPAPVQEALRRGAVLRDGPRGSPHRRWVLVLGGAPLRHLCKQSAGVAPGRQGAELRTSLSPRDRTGKHTVLPGSVAQWLGISLRTRRSRFHPQSGPRPGLRTPSPMRGEQEAADL